MDDGSLQIKVTLSTYNFSYEEVILLKNTLENLFKPDFLVNALFITIKKVIEFIFEKEVLYQ